jgi:hypothetical protein
MVRQSTLFLSLLSTVVIGLAGCGGSQTPVSGSSPVTSPASSPVTSSSTPHDESKPHSHNDDHGHDHGGQTLEVGQYHLGLHTQKQANGILLNFDLQQEKDHTPIPNAKVTAQVRLPDGSQQPVDFKFDPSDKHYKATLATTATGELKVVMLADIGGEKVNGRFTIKN